MIAFAIAPGFLLILPWAPSGQPARWPANWAAMLARQSVSHAASRLGSRSRQPARPGQIWSTMRNPRENQKKQKNQRFQRNLGTPTRHFPDIFCFFGFFGFPNGFATFVCRAMLGRNTTDHYIHYTRTYGWSLCVAIHYTRTYSILFDHGVNKATT